MKLKILYRKNLKMSPGKLAAQCVHAAAGAGYTGGADAVVVLGVSCRKFSEFKPHAKFVVCDAGRTEVEPGTETALAFYEP